ncbi:MAG: heavy metal translocating P-type ATPase metal-binding domain-containing protein [Bacteroidetes bacterium]|nr:heavy metal translocating P-type ATPase metal-binding domain-containing protein [Bacteroidota bacterium]
MGQPCVHCGEDCGKHPVMWEEKPFCCHGCKTVYQILNEKELKQYYEIEQMPGIRVETEEVGDKYAYLDLEEIKEKLLDFSDGGVSKVTLFIPAIHCASCIWLLENMNTLHPGIINSTVNFPKKEVYITFKDDEISLRKVVELLASIHYIPEITLERVGQQKSKKSSTTLLLKIGITGFVLMNVMMYNFPEYLPGGELLEDDFKKLFGWLSLFLSIPVVVYCSNDYYLTAIKSLKHKIISIDLPIALGIITLFLQSAYDIITGSGIGYLDSLSGLVFFLLIGKWYQSKTYQALSFERDYKSYFPVAVTKIHNGAETVMPLENLKEGDHILVRNQELIPADSRIFKGEGNIDYSFVTGESIPVAKQTGDPVFAGGRQVGSAVELEVTRDVEQSYLTQLWNQEKSADKYESRLNILINNVSQYFTVIILSIAFGAGIYWLFIDQATAIFVFTSVLIVACPCALALTVPFTFGSTLRQFGRQGFYLKKTEVIEQLHKVTSIVFDKTGTITQNKALKTEFIGDALSDDQIRMIKSLVRHSTHPLSAALFANLPGEEFEEVENFKELPGLGITGMINGTRLNVGSRKFVTGKTDDVQGLKSTVYVFIGNKIMGHFQLENQYRSGLKEVIEDLGHQYDLHLLTGDNEAEKPNLIPLFRDETRLKFNQTPTDKLDYVKALKAKGKTVLMVGDGLNDAGALNESDVGITIADDIYHFSPACDAILESSKFRSLNRYIRFTRTSMTIVKISFVISFLYNIGGLFFAVQGMLTPVIAAILMPISSVSVVAFVTFAVSHRANKVFRN